MVEKVQGDHRKSVYDEDEEGREGKGKQEKSKTPQSEANLVEIWEVALSPSAAGAELAKYQCCSRRTTEKNGSGDENLTRSADRRNQLAWSTERQYMRRYRGKCDIFLGIEHRLRKEEREEQLNREAKEGRRFAADAARITDERASSEDRKHTSGGVFLAVDSNL